MDKNGIILLSGGLDSLVSLDIASRKMNIELALMFDYGQYAYYEEKQAAIDIANFYNLKLKFIDLPFIKEMNCANKNFEDFESVWVPNRNGLFLNIAASFCDKYNYDFIVFGANKEEGRQFPDNSDKFVKISDEFFKYSTLNKPIVFAPCLQFDKIEIVNYAIDNNVPLKFLKSCYDSSLNTGKKHCGKCLSCKLLKNAIQKSKKPELIEEIF